jgi:hypothetical protein
MRYLIGFATWLVPWLRGPVPPRYWRKVVAAVQGITLTVVAGQVLPWPVNDLALLLALALLAESFGRDVVWQWQHRQVAPLRSTDRGVGHLLVVPAAPRVRA